ncbi:MAG: heme o synthase [Chitinophagales bacterium]|nr:heme o synthase [Chitinophagales bacterium]MDW8428585.1 heme o synthase [Chitinophagales bacterium]
MNPARVYSLTFPGIKAWIRDVSLLTKLRLSVLVVFSAAIGFLLASGHSVVWNQFFLLVFGGFLVTAASNALNQIIEKDYDRLMDRTRGRPLPAERMGINEALLIAGTFAFCGLTIFLVYFNALSAILSALALIVYAFIYTPLKRFTPAAVFVGALPGALPPLIGAVSAAGTFTTEGWLLFAIQFLWQFPHFWAVAWVAYDDYLKAGYYLLPSRQGRNRFSALQILWYTLMLVPVSVLPSVIGVSGINSFIVNLGCSLLFLYVAIQLVYTGTIAWARRLMFASFLYLPLVQLSVYFDRQL